MALRHLSLRDFVIVQQLELDLHDGFSALTGETGAGKSILVDAVQLVLGARGDALWVREGQEQCDISAEFDVPASALPWLADNGFQQGGEPMLLRRSIDRNGRSRAWINGARATIAQLRELADHLIDIHGQHAWQSLTRPAAIRALLDAYAGVDLSALTEHWQDWQQAKTALEAAAGAQQALSAERERVNWQIMELERLAPQPDEWEQLNQRHARLANAQALLQAAQAAEACLQDEDGSGGALAALAAAQTMLQPHAAIEPEFANLLDILVNCEAQLQDVAHSLRGYLHRADLDPGQLAELDRRISDWLGLARRFGSDPERLHILLMEAHGRLAQLDQASDLDQLRARAERAESAWRAEAVRTSKQRAQAAPRLAKAITAAMQTLGMQGGMFEVQLSALARPSAYGMEDVRFLVAAHAGTTPHEIERVASGGELSRLALAIAVAGSARGTAATLIFDEVDAGVGGAIAATVGQLLRDLGRSRQVLCVTHLPQVAACAQHHLHVSKGTDESGHTISSVGEVLDEARTQEIARMLGGRKISSTTIAHAREMLAAAGTTT